MHARLAAQRMQAPLFLVQSSLDAWQLANIWRGATLTNSSIDPRSCIGSLYEAPRHTITRTRTRTLTRTLTLPHRGIAKCCANHPDVLHSYYALCGLSLAGQA